MITTILNNQGGSATKAREALTQYPEFQILETEAEQVEATVRKVMEHAPDRIAVSGGDGTICAAAAAVVESDVALAILPGGTLNHFAKDHGIPVDIESATRVAIHGQITQTDVAYAGDRLFLNTSSVGAYVSYVRLRERLERYVGYRLASILATFRLLFSIKSVLLHLEVDGNVIEYLTPLVFIGVGERELQAPHLGSRVPGGQKLLHVMVIRERSAARLMVLALAAATRGVEQIARTPQLDSYFVDRCTIGTLGRSRRVALDGEIVRMEMPIEYRIAIGALKIVTPEGEE